MTDDAVPGPTMACCPYHVHMPNPPACPQCRADCYELALSRMADPMSTLTPKGVVDLARQALERGRRL